jgi:RNA recognition motif-containing protein
MTLLCCNLPEGVTEERLRQLFSDFGEVLCVEAHMGYTREGCWRAHAYVTMKNDSEAVAALRGLGGVPWAGRRLCVAWA